MEIAVEIDGGGRFVFVSVTVGAGELRFESVNPERLVGGVVQRHGDGNEQVLRTIAWAGNLGGSDEINGAGSLRLGALLEHDNAYHDGDRCNADKHDACGREITFGSPEFFADVEVGGGLGE